MAKRKKKTVPSPRPSVPGKEPKMRLDYWVALFITIVTLAVFFPALRNEFVGWDDFELLVENLNYRGLGWDQLRWMFTTFHTGHYQPLSWITFGLDYLLWGMNPLGYHLTNLVLHAASAVLFYFLSLRLLSLALSIPSGSVDSSVRAAAGFAALFFAIHPLRVESVAWATERRDVLSGLFFLATIVCYLRAVTAPTDMSHRRRWLGASLTCYALSLLSKASGATLPIVLLLLDVYPLRRLGWGAGKWFEPSARPIWWEKVPFLFLAAGAAVIAPLAQRDAGAVASLRAHGVASRLAQSLYGLAFYLWKTILPTDLSPFYEVPPHLNPFAWPFLLSGAVVAILSIGLLVLRRRWPAGLAGWICYVVIVAPVLGFVQSGRQMVADRYSYLSCLAWAILAGGGLYYLWQRGIDRRNSGRKPFLLATGAAALMIIGLGFLTWKQVEVWHDTDTLWKRVLAVTDKSTFRSGTAHHLVGRFYSDRGDLDRAIEHLRISIDIEPTDATTYTDLGVALARQGKLEEAIQNLQHALSLNPRLSLTHFNLGNAFALQGRFGEAAEHLEDALRIKPDYAEAYNNLGKVLAAQGQVDSAIDLFRRAVQVQPNFADAHQSLALALHEKGRTEEAIQEFQEAQRIMKLQTQARR
jgi:protein O-mannosyl-transferase